MFDPWQQSHPQDAAFLTRCRDAVQEVAPGATVILYGSRARGDAEPESDYDLLVLVEGPSSRQLEDQIGDRLYALELESDTRIESPRVRETHLEHSAVQSHAAPSQCRPRGNPVVTPEERGACALPLTTRAGSPGRSCITP